jgi:hypothetical protein
VPKPTLSQAAAAAQLDWVGRNIEELRFLAPGRRSALSARAGAAARNSAAGLARRFPGTALPVVLWGGVLTASVIGAAVWSAQIPAQHGKAATTAAAYGLVALSAAAGIAVNSRALLDDLARFGPQSRTTFLQLWPALLAVFAVVYGFVDGHAIARAAHGHTHSQFTVTGEFAAFAELTTVGVVLGLLIAAASQADALGRVGDGASLSWTGAMALGLADRDDSAVRRSGHTLDEPMLGLLNTAAGAARVGAGSLPDDHATIRALISGLEVAAARAQGFASGRVPMLDFTTRVEADRDGARLASLIRGFKAPLARATRPADFTAAAVAMTDLLLAWADDDGEGLGAMLDKAPDVRRPSLWQRLRSRIGNAVLLAAAGVALPELPIYAHDPAAAIGARYTLLTAAVFALVTGGAPAWDTIGSVLDKAVGGEGGEKHQEGSASEGGKPEEAGARTSG